MKMESDTFSALSFKKDQPAIVYAGPPDVKEFRIEKVMAYTGVHGKYTYFNFTIRMDRIYTDQIISTFFPTLLLWLLAYFTIYIKVDYFNERIMVSVTVLLVLAALLSSIKDRIPSTSYFKYIDLWFLWYTAYLFSITIYHILLHQAIDTGTKDRITLRCRRVKPEKYDEKSRKDMINDRAKVLLLLPFLLFNAIYFFLLF